MEATDGAIDAALLTIRALVGAQQADRYRRAVAIPLQTKQAAGCFECQACCRVAGCGPVLSERRNRYIDECRVALVQLGIAQAEFREITRIETFDEDIGA